ncbi:hypothetical protein ACFE04_020673 [Oxalis oulophora]
MNGKKVDESDAFDHLIINGFMPLYLTWNLLGEVASSTSSSRTEVHLDGNNNSMDEGLIMTWLNVDLKGLVSEDNQMRYKSYIAENFHLGKACTMAKRANTKRKRTFCTSATTLPNEEPDRGNDSPLGATSAVVDTTQRNVRKGTQMHFLWEMKADNKLDVELDGEGRPINDGGSDYSRFLGTVARRPYLFPISYLRWDNISDEHIDSVWTQEIEPRFHFFPAEHSLNIKKLSIKQLNDKWRQWKHDLKDKHFDYSKSNEANVKVIEAKEPDRVDVDQYLILVRHWLSNEGKQSSETNKANVSNYKDPHCAGSKPFHQIAIELKLFDKKQEARKARDKAREENPELAEVFGISDDDSELDNDDYTEIKGKSKRGHLNCSGHRPNSIKNVASGSDLARQNNCDLATKVVQQAEEKYNLLSKLPSSYLSPEFDRFNYTNR